MTEYVLSITSSGGNGHLSATDQLEKHEKGKKRVIIRMNTLECYGKPIGRLFTSWWNDAQKAGNVDKLRFLLKLKKLAEVVFATPLFICTLYYLYKYNVVKVIDTQPLGTVSIIRAVALANFFKNKSIKIRKVMTDLPPRSEHFYSGIRKISNSQKRYFKLISCPPFLKKGESDEFYWQRKCRLSFKKNQVKYKAYPVRDEFFAPKALKKVQVNLKEEKSFLKAILPNQSFTTEGAYKSLNLDITDKDRVSFVLLASQATETAMVNYLKKIAKVKNSAKDSQNHYLFLLCSKNEVNKPSLYKKVCAETKQLKLKGKIPENLFVIPLSFQNSEVLASLFNRADEAIIRPSGLVTMELLTAAGKETNIYIHCEGTKKISKTAAKLLKKKMPDHEWGNTTYLRRKRKAKLITPKMIKKFFAASAA